MLAAAPAAQGLSLGDRCCLAAGRARAACQRSRPIRAWAGLGLRRQDRSDPLTRSDAVMQAAMTSPPSSIDPAEVARFSALGGRVVGSARQVRAAAPAQPGAAGLHPRAGAGAVRARCGGAAAVRGAEAARHRLRRRPSQRADGAAGLRGHRASTRRRTASAPRAPTPLRSGWRSTTAAPPPRRCWPKARARSTWC